MPTHATTIEVADRIHMPGRFELWLDKQPPMTAEYRGRHRGRPAPEVTAADPAPVS